MGAVRNVLPRLTVRGTTTIGPNFLGGLLNLAAPTASSVPLVIRAAPAPTSDLIVVQNSGASTIFAVRPDGQLSLVPATIQTATAGAGQATPANVALFYSITLTNGVNYRIPLYNP